MHQNRKNFFLISRYGKHTSEWVADSLLLLVAMLFFSSCFKGDTPVALPAAAADTVFTVNMGPLYTWEDYFSLIEGDTTGGGWHADWDLAFESSDTGSRVWLNGGNKGLAADMNTPDFNSVTSIVGAVWKWDEASWDRDSTAIGNWNSDDDVYIIDRGILFSGADRYWKIIFQSVTPTQYQIQFAHLDGSNLSTVSIPKDPAKTYVFYSLPDGGQLACPWQPATPQWDLQFTRYSYIFYSVSPPLQYPVTGVLTQPGELVAVDSVTSYSAMNLNTAEKLTYSDKRDAIGYNWKTYSFTTAAYTVKTYYVYVIRDEQGHYWKLHFLDFYNPQGLKGYPQFEFKELQ